MSHLAYQPPGPAVELEADYVVVGSGAGGAMAAVTLARGGAKVVVVEAGPWRDPEDYPSTAYAGLRDLFDDWGTLITSGRAFWPVVQGRAVGGTTVINSAICVRTPGDIFESWKKDHGIDGLADSVWRYQDQIERELSVEEVPERARGHSNRLAIIGAEKVGYESHVMRRYVKHCQGEGQCLQGCRGRRKQSTNITYIPEVQRLGGQILSCAPVERVRIEGRTAVGVEGRFVHPATKKKGARYFVRATKAVLVAASAVHTPLILMRSGVKSPALGEHFRSHPGTGVFGLFDDPVDMNIGATQGWASTAFRENPGLKLETLAIPPEMVASRLAGGGAELTRRLSRYRHMAMWVHAVRAESVGSVRPGLFGKPVVRYSFNRRDMERLRKGLHIVAQTHIAAGAKAVVPGIFGLPYELKADEIDKILEASLEPRNYVAVLSHLFGGAVMGADPARSVVDGTGKVHGYERLYVADAAALPTTLGVNPQHTIMGVAATFAEGLLSAQGQKPKPRASTPAAA
ncbi:MAG: GMC family oxidoreductase [Deltaproteobacteria bacterium]|nr:GMC family oxidoreductase [Deltaproteobacteria bacterium]